MFTRPWLIVITIGLAILGFQIFILFGGSQIETPVPSEIEQLKVQNMVLDLQRMDAEIRGHQSEIANLHTQSNKSTQDMLNFLGQMFDAHHLSKDEWDLERNEKGMVMVPLAFKRKVKAPDSEKKPD